MVQFEAMTGEEREEDGLVDGHSLLLHVLEHRGGASDVPALAVEPNQMLEGDPVGHNLGLLHLLQEVTRRHIVSILQVDFQNRIVVRHVEC